MDFMRSLVRGFIWKARMSNGAVFSIWTPMDISRAQAKKLLLREAGEDIYSSGDIEQIWRTIS